MIDTAQLEPALRKAADELREDALRKERQRQARTGEIDIERLFVIERAYSFANVLEKYCAQHAAP
jgi:hypothetical protein